MPGMSAFFIVINILLFGYTCYSWYWQANLDLRGKYRLSVLIWTIFMIWLGFTWNYLVADDWNINIFLALILVTSIIDGFTGFAPHRVVVSGYFKRTVPYSKITDITLIKLPLARRTTVVCMFNTSDHHRYLLQFQKSVAQIMNTLKTHIDHRISIKVQDGMM